MKNLTVAVMIGMLLMVGAMRFLTAVQEADPELRMARVAQAAVPRGAGPEACLRACLHGSHAHPISAKNRMSIW